MAGPLIIDNWILMEIRDLFASGFSSDSSGEIVINSQENSHSFKYFPHGVFQIDAILSLISNLILRDFLVVDDEFMYTWDTGDQTLNLLQEVGMVKGFAFSKTKQEWIGVRKAIVDELCITDTIRNIQIANEKSWMEGSELYDEHMSALVWGAAGMLARSHFHQAPYVGHPLRQRLVEQTAFINYRLDALQSTMKTIQDGRTKLFQYVAGSEIRKYATFSLPPLATEIIREANSPKQLFTIAFQLRDKYTRLRNWLKEYQQAIDKDDIASMLKQRKKLDSVARGINATFGPTSDGGTNLSLGVSWLSIGVPKNLLARIANRFGVRANLSQLFLTGSGKDALRKLISMFGEENTKLSRDIYKHVLARYSEV